MHTRIRIRLAISTLIAVPIAIVLVLIHAALIYVAVSNASSGWGPPWRPSQTSQMLEQTLGVISLNPVVWMQPFLNEIDLPPNIPFYFTILWIPFLSFTVAFLAVSLLDKESKAAEQDAAANP